MELLGKSLEDIFEPRQRIIKQDIFQQILNSSKTR